MNGLDLDKLAQQRMELLAAARDLERRIDELGQLIDQAREPDRGGIDYDTIQRCAERFTFGPHPLSRPEYTEIAKPYLLGLLQLAQFEARSQMELLIFIQWIHNQANVREKLSTLLQKSYTDDKNRLYSRLERLSDDSRDLPTMFILDLLIGASLNGPASEDILDYIAELAAFLKLDEARLSAISLAARCSLCGTVGSAEHRMLDHLPRVCAIYLPEQFKRVKLKIPSPVFKWKWYCQTGAYVEKGQKLGKDEVGPGKVYAPCSGVLVRWIGDFKPCGVIGWYGDDKASVKNWLKLRDEGRK